ncbi:hypothetical protein BKA61DRAFT_574505 [Leptodontidium sp. MPI-SDFR-AT-0119]|nr:hypothetical protein BKA61DRAFT_574505 [Leptodontidium sp. MPI-SDFR-AT-0119]
MESPPMSPMAWLLERACGTPASAGSFAGKLVSELQIFEAERPDAPRHVQQYLAERRTYVDFWGSDELHLFPSLTSAMSSPSKTPKVTGTRPTPPAPGASPVHKPSVHSSTLRVAPSISKKGDSYRPRSRSRHRDESYYRSHWDPRSRSVSPRRESRRDYRLKSSSRTYDIYGPRGSRSRYRSPSPRAARHRDPSRSPPSREARPTEQPTSWQKLAERIANKDPATLRGPATTRRFTIPSSEIRDNLHDADMIPIAVSKVHVKARTGKPFLPLQFKDPRASQMLLGKHGDALEEVEEVLDNLDSKSPKGLVNLWLEVKSSSDPLNDGVKWQIDACHRGFEAYQRRD